LNTRPSDSPDAEQPFLSHLVELRGRLLKSLLAVLIVLVVLLPFANDIYELLARPVLDRLPAGQTMIAIEVASPFLTPFKLTAWAAIFLCMPVLFYQLWAFIAPGLYRKERRFGWPLLVSSVFLFYGGVAFAYFVVFPLAFAFFFGVAPAGVAVMPDINKYLDFMLTLFFAFGLAFEVPIATILAVAAGLTTPEKLAKKRAYVIVVAFVAGMLLTPPDVISQTLLAIPIWVLFELGIQMSKLMVPAQPEPAPDQET